MASIIAHAVNCDLYILLIINENFIRQEFRDRLVTFAERIFSLFATTGVALSAYMICYCTRLSDNNCTCFFILIKCNLSLPWVHLVVVGGLSTLQDKPQVYPEGEANVPKLSPCVSNRILISRSS